MDIGSIFDFQPESVQKVIQQYFLSSLELY